MPTKEFKSIDEQIAILQSRGLTINDLKYAKEFLYKNNYYRVSGYSLTLRKHDVFSETAEFQNIIDIYEFDHELRHILLKYIELIEVTIKSIYAYEFSKKYGPTEYLNCNHFTNSDKHTAIISKAEQQKEGKTVKAFVIYALVGVIGYFLTVGLTLLGTLVTGESGFWYLVLTCAVKGIVLIWNYIGRKLLVYRGK